MSHGSAPAFNVIETDSVLSTLPTLALGNEILLLTSAGFTTRGMVAEITRCLAPASVQVVDRVTPNPELNFLSELLSDLSPTRFSAIVALGGGSVMDAAKVLSRMLGQPPQQLRAVLTQGSTLPDSEPLLLVTIPTSSGTGAEVTPFATVWDSASQSKFSFADRIPDITLLDAGLTQSLPRNETLYSGLDALSHALESLWNKRRTASSQRHALRAIDEVLAALPQVMAQPDSLSARRIMLSGANQAGRAITETRTALAHAMSYSLTLKYGIPHGLACSFTLPVLLSLFTSEELSLSDTQRQGIERVLATLKLDDEVTRYAPASQIIAEYDYNLEPSRAKNFIRPVTPELIEQVLHDSLQQGAAYVS